MNAISWNCLGLVASLTVQELCDLCIRVKPTLLLLMETKAKRCKAEDMKRKLHFDKIFYVEPEGLSGGLYLMWTKRLEIEVLDAWKNYVHTFYIDKDKGCDWDYTCVWEPQI